MVRRAFLQGSSSQAGGLEDGNGLA